MIYQQPAAAAAGTPRQRTPRQRTPRQRTPRQRTPRQRTPRLRLQPHISSPINDIPAAGGCCSRNSAPTTPRLRLQPHTSSRRGCSRNSAPTTPRQSLPHRWGKARRNSAPGWPYQQPHTSSRRLLQPELRANELRAGMAIPAARLRAFGCSPIPAAAAAAAGTPRQRLRANDSAPTNSAPGWPYQQPDSAPSAAAGTPRQRLRAFGCSPIPAARLRANDSAPSAAARLRANDSAPTTPRQRTPRLRLQPHTSSPINDIPAAGGCCSRNSAPTNSAPSAAAPYQQPDSAPSAAAGTPRQRLRANRCPTGGARRAGTPRQRLRANDSAPTTPRQRTPRLRLQPELRANELRAGMAIPAAPYQQPDQPHTSSRRRAGKWGNILDTIARIYNIAAPAHCERCPGCPGCNCKTMCKVRLGCQKARRTRAEGADRRISP